jgi:hypothetical protein
VRQETTHNQPNVANDDYLIIWKHFRETFKGKLYHEFVPAPATRLIA